MTYFPHGHSDFGEVEQAIFCISDIVWVTDPHNFTTDGNFTTKLSF